MIEGNRSNHIMSGTMESGAKKFKFRLVIKLHDLAHFFFIDKQRSDELISLKRVNKLFTSIRARRILELVNRAKKSDPSYRPPNFLNYYSIVCNDENEARRIADVLNRQDSVEHVYVETQSASPPSVMVNSNPLTVYQQYLNAAPVGIDARYAWRFPGGDGSGKVKFIDIEQGWIMNHEDLKINRLPCTGINHYKHEDHGAAVLGVIMMLNNEIGGMGITPNTNGYVVSQWRSDGTFNTADAIMVAIERLHFGDLLLLEAQSFDALQTKKIWPVESLNSNFQLIRLATALGIVVVEAAGNGMYSSGNDLDDFSDDEGKNILNRSKKCFKDSGAILVAAASSKTPHTRINYSNYGSRIDCYAWGENVVTAGYYPRSSGLSKNAYTEKFCGTSSASAIIAGAAIAVQNIVERKYGFRLNPKQMRKFLSSKKYGTGSKHGHLTDKIGVMPDLKKIIDRVLKSNFIKEKALSMKGVS